MPRITNRHGLSPVFEIALQRAYAEYRNVGWRSATGLADSPRQKILLERHQDEIEIDVADSLSMLDGIALHDFLGNLAAYEPNVITEKSMILMVEGKAVKMQPDRIEPIDGPMFKATKWSLKDFKKTLVGAWQAGGRESWELQGNIYRLGAMALLGLNIVQIQFELILRNWSEAETVKHDYPPSPIMPIDIPIWDEQEAWNYLKERVKLFSDCEKLADDDLPDCTPSERWQKSDMWQVWNKDPKTTKCYRQHYDQAEAIKIQQGMSKPDKYEVRFKAGYSKRCEKCEVRHFCNLCRNEKEDD